MTYRPHKIVIAIFLTERVCREFLGMRNQLGTYLSELGEVRWALFGVAKRSPDGIPKTPPPARNGWSRS